MVRTLITLTLLIATGPATLAEPPTSTRSVTDRYVELTLSQKYDALAELYAPDATFLDPTADVFSGPVAQGTVVGADKIIAMQKGWGLAETRFDRHASFTVGQYSLYRGVLTVRYAGAEATFDIPFMTVLRVEQGRISERLDFGEYIASFKLGEAFDEATTSTRRIADRYLEAYLDEDFERQAELMADQIKVQDPTAAYFGGTAGDPLQGAQTVLSQRRRTFAGVRDFTFDTEESFYANHHAVFMGSTSYRLDSGVRFTQPAVVVIEVRDGNVTRHWDFVDYTVGPDGSTADGSSPKPATDSGPS